MVSQQLLPRPALLLPGWGTATTGCEVRASRVAGGQGGRPVPPQRKCCPSLQLGRSTGADVFYYLKMTVHGTHGNKPGAFSFQCFASNGPGFSADSSNKRKIKSKRRQKDAGLDTRFNMPRKLNVSDADYQEKDYLDLSESDSEFEDEDMPNPNAIPRSKAASNSNTIEILTRAFQSIDNDSFLTVFKNAICNCALEFVGGCETTSKRGKRAACSMNNAPAYLNVEKKVISRFNAKLFLEVLDSLTDRQKALVRDYGFESLLDFGCSNVPHNFAAWICDRVDCKLGGIVLRHKFIKLSPQSVQRVLGLPLGGRDILKSKVDSKPLFVSRSNPKKRPTYYEQCDKLKQSDLSDDDFMRTFLSIACSCFLCPSASVHLSPKYLGPLVDVKDAKNWNWCKFVYDWMIKNIRVFQSSPRDSASLSVCMYYICVVYLDHLDFASEPVPPPVFPRIKVWKGQMVKKFSELDRKKKSKNYGCRPVKSTSETCYAISACHHADVAGPSSADAASDDGLF